MTEAWRRRKRGAGGSITGRGPGERARPTMGQGDGVGERASWVCAPGLSQPYEPMEPKPSPKTRAPEPIHASISKTDKEHTPEKMVSVNTWFSDGYFCNLFFFLLEDNCFTM